MSDKSDFDIQLFLFGLDEWLYGINVNQVNQTLDYGKITSSPEIPEYMLGIVNIKGKSVPVIDFKKRFTGTNLNILKNTAIIILDLRYRENTVSLGAAVDRIYDVLSIDPEDIEPVSNFSHFKSVKSINAFVKTQNRVIQIVNIYGVFRDDEIRIAIDINNK